MARPLGIGAVTAAALLEMFLQRRWELSEDEADELYGILIGLLERCRDETYRMRKAEL